ncbi:MAG: peptidoglycan editing factor PgeF [Candidatus Moranbacteria bacterium]|nr:peptidoglycan editing factor PgeF [Candidatus Moranbacteria bacterium]
MRNRKKFLRTFGIFPEDVSSGELVHGNQVRRVLTKNKGVRFKDADGLITGRKNIFLSVTAADCLPIFLFEPKKEIVGLVHAGWRSLEMNILENAIGKMEDLGGTPENILAGIGPAICQKHYEVGPEVAEKFVKYPEAIGNGNNKIFLDIKKVAEMQLLSLGVSGKNIEISSACTFELPKKYFSARRDKPQEIEAMMAAIGIKE